MADEVKCDGIVDQADHNSHATTNDRTITMDNRREEEDTGSKIGPNGQEETAVDAVDVRDFCVDVDITLGRYVSYEQNGFLTLSVCLF